jgi:hypothetical protein
LVVENRRENRHDPALGMEIAKNVLIPPRQDAHDIDVAYLPHGAWVVRRR